MARDDRLQEVISELGLPQSVGADFRNLLDEWGYDPKSAEWLDIPFRPKKRRRASRFSDGSFPVFYSSLDSETAQAEVRHWGPAFLGNPRRSRTAFYRLFHCTFHGVEKDLRACRAAWPELVHETDYALCNRIGAEAIQLDVDGLVTWSARRPVGANLPVFSRASLRDPVAEGLMALTYEPADGSVSLRPL